MIEYLNHFSHNLTLFVIFPALFCLGLYLTVRLKGIQFTKLGLGFRHMVTQEKDSDGDISNFEAVSAVLAGNLGTGNISGMAVALAVGGPGALVWMWVMATLGTVIKFAGCTLGLKYREKNEQGEYVGGPMYYLSKGLKFKGLAIFFSIAAIITSLTVGNLVQVNSIFLPLKKMGFSPHLLVSLLVFFTALLLFGGLNRIAKVLGTMVPIMTFIYLGCTLVILGIYHEALPHALMLIFKSSVSSTALVGGGLGYGLTRALSSGFERGIFATDAGCGIAPILQSGAKCKKPILEGVVGMIAPFIVMIICTMTALVLIVTGAWSSSGETSTNMCTWAFTQGLGHHLGGYVVILSLVLFAFTTIITWAYCGEKAVEFLKIKRAQMAFKLLFLIVLPLGAYCQTHFVWALADISIAMMLISNLIGVFGLSKEVIADTQEEFGKKKIA